MGANGRLDQSGSLLRTVARLSHADRLLVRRVQGCPGLRKRLNPPGPLRGVILLATKLLTRALTYIALRDAFLY